MLDRTRIVSRDLAAARRFYGATARALGLTIIEAEEDSFTLGRIADMSTPVLRVRSAAGRTQADEPETQPAMVSLEVSDDYSVRAFYRAGSRWPPGRLSRAAADTGRPVVLRSARRRPRRQLHRMRLAALAKGQQRLAVLTFS